jgi:hypothetical protein
MKLHILICLVVALMASVSADNFSFSYGCNENNECVAPGEGYCGKGFVDIVRCYRAESICDVACKPLTHRPAKDEWEYATIKMTPTEKMTGEPVYVEMTDTRDGSPLFWEIEVYKGTGDSRILIETIATDRSGVASFTPMTPGEYTIKSAGKEPVFEVGGTPMQVEVCGDGTCSSSEGCSACPQDCGECARCGDGSCQESCSTCPQDCGECLPSGPACGDGVCNGDETQGTCPQDCQAPAAQGGADMTLIIVLAAVLLVLVLVVLLAKSGKLKLGKPPAEAKPTEEKKEPDKGKCSKCGTELVEGSQFCPKCGNRAWE